MHGTSIMSMHLRSSSSAQYSPIGDDPDGASHQSVAEDSLHRPDDSPLNAVKAQSPSIPARKLARHTVGIFCLLVTVFLWTVSNFLASVSNHSSQLNACTYRK